MQYPQFKGLCPLIILASLIESTCSATIRDDFSLSICKSEPSRPLFRRQGSWLGLDNDNLTSTIGSSWGCPTTRQVAYIGVVADCTYTAGFNSTDSARDYIHEMVNTASVVYENSFNISLRIQNLTISDPNCPSGGSSGNTDWNAPCSTGDMNWRLREFSSWRGSLEDDNAYWTLLTGCPDGGQVGVSWIGALCTSGPSYGYYGAGTNVVARTQNDWEVFA